MAWEYKILEPMDYGHPGAAPRYAEFAKELAELAKDGWEIVQITPSMLRGRIVEGGREDTINLTTVAILAVLRRQVADAPAPTPPQG
jgi:hypothetical protein